MKILYIYDVKGWAIHKVGLLWLKTINHDVSFKSISEISDIDLNSNDLIWYGYSHLYFKKPADLNKSVIALHDPAEIFGQFKYWKYSRVPLTINLKVWFDYFKKFSIRNRTWKLLKRAKNIVVISKEMHTILKKNNIDSYILQTTTDLDVKNEIKQFDKVSVITVCNKHLRKNFSLIKKLQKFCNKGAIEMYLKLGSKILDTSEYTQLIDEHQIYICTSFQEGGPLPAMDAMARGLIVLTTPVGQIQDIIIDGYNGYICRTEKDFKEKIFYLKSNIEILKNLSLRSIETIKNRSVLNIQQQAEEYLNNLSIKVL